MSTVTLRDYRPEDREQVFSLMAEIYDEAVVANSRGHWEWQYHRNPRNLEGRPDIRIVDRDGEVVAMICGLRQSFYLDGQIVSGLWVVDFMARQAGTDHKQRLRYGKRLASELKQTQPLVAGVNRPALNRYWKRVLGDQIDICAVPMMIRPLRPERIARQRFGNPLLATAASVAGRAVLPVMYRQRRRPAPEGIALERVNRCDAEVDRFFEAVAGGFTNLCVRDAAYLNWRYLDIPDREYQIHLAREGERVRGLVVTRMMPEGNLRKGRIVDILAAHDDLTMWHYLLSGAVQILAGAGADLVHGLGSTVQPLMDAYAECGFRPNPEHRRVSQYIAYTTADGVDPDVFYDGNSWYVTFGDSDTDFATPA